jgi:hypothetical protein
MISAVQYVHERGLLHLDIKPVRAGGTGLFAGAHRILSQVLTPAVRAAQDNFCLVDDSVHIDDAKVRVLCCACARCVRCRNRRSIVC